MVLRPLDSSSLLRSLGYSFEALVEPASSPDTVDKRFRDIIPEFSSTPIGGEKLYRHQLEAYNALRSGRNVVLRSGTGSGKTEAWVLYAIERLRADRCKVLAVYPTLALANDQVRRITLYSEAVGLNVVKLDAQSRDELRRAHGETGLRRIVAGADIVATNPAFLLHEVKKLVLAPSRSLLEPVFRRLCLLVIDELDFYGPRGIALLLAVVELLSRYSETGLQVAILGATIAGVEDLALFLERVTGRETAIIEGRPFRPENRTYIVLGKRLEDLRLKILEAISGSESKIPGEVLEVLKNPKKFMENAHRVTAVLQALGFNVPSPGLDYVEILSRYVDDSGVTIVFTRSIAAAEHIYHRLRERLGDKASLVAVHHHLVPKKVREEVEEKARRNEVKIIITPRTLLQGIDVGTVVRVVHMGLPEDVREYVQREGRKGRRRDIEYTETIIIPFTRWDHELLARGVEVLEKWLSLPLEKTIVNPDNAYKHLFTGLAKLLSPWMGGELSREELEVLKKIGVVGDKGARVEEAKKIWDRINFYEYGPPYGVKRYLEKSDGVEPLEPIGFCDLVERFQVGCIDPSSDAIVVGLKRGRSSRTVTAVVEKPLRDFNPWSLDAIAEAYEEYRMTKMRWGEQPNLVRDALTGRLTSEVITVVYPPRNGFGLLRKIPNRVLWLLHSEKPVVVKGPHGYIVTYRRKPIYVAVNTAGEYRDYTYGVVVEASENDSPTMLRLGLAYLMILLRRYMALPLETFKYGVGKLGEKKFIEIHEPEAAGILLSMEWQKLRKIVESHEPDELDELLLLEVDELAYTELYSLENPWHVLREAALRVIDILTSIGRVRAVLGEREVTVPKPSRSLRILAIDVVAERVGSNEVVPEVLASIAIYDGEEVHAATTVYSKLPFSRPPRELREAETVAEELVYYEGFKPVVYDKEATLKALHEAGLRRLEQLVYDAHEVKTMLRGVGIPSDVGLEALVGQLRVKGIDVDVNPSLVDVVAKIASSPRITRKALEAVEAYVGARARAVYILYLVARELGGRRA